MSLQRQLAIATRGYRGDIGAKYYINESIDLVEPGGITVDIFETVPVVSVDEIGVVVSSVENIDLKVTVNQDTIDIAIPSVEQITIEDC